MSETIDTAAPRSRRALLAGGLGAAGALVATSLHAPTALAGVDGDVVLGSAANASASTTKITVPTQDYSAFWGEATGGNGVGVRGDANATYGIGVLGSAASQAGNGVKGTSAGTGVFGVGGLQGVYGFSTTGIGVYGAGPEAGMKGTSTHGVGIQGESGDGFGVRAIANSSSGRGLYATNTTGRAVEARSDSGWGVYGRSDSAHGVHGSGQGGAGVGVYGESSAGTGVFGISTNGYALRTRGRLMIEKVSGVATIGAGKTSVTVTPGVDVTTASFVLLTPMVSLGTRALWFTRNTTANTITIRINVARGASSPISWLLLG